jgi:N6-adenosine-specific RNA methylase IME4
MDTYTSKSARSAAINGLATSTQQGIAALATPAVPTPVIDLAGTYSVILADPPWRYDFAAAKNRTVEQHYPTMTLETIKAMKIPAEDNAVLYLWATAPKLLEALEVLKAWGFSYKTQMVWDKEHTIPQHPA